MQKMSHICGRSAQVLSVLYNILIIIGLHVLPREWYVTVNAECDHNLTVCHDFSSVFDDDVCRKSSHYAFRISIVNSSLAVSVMTIDTLCQVTAFFNCVASYLWCTGCQIDGYFRMISRNRLRLTSFWYNLSFYSYLLTESHVTVHF